MIIRKCPANCDIPEGNLNDEGKFIQTGWEDRNFCLKYKKNCDKVEKCILKQFLNFVDVPSKNYWEYLSEVNQ